jgi:ferrochelatase
MEQPYDAVLFISFGGPEAPGDVLPFLENVLRGKNVPRERMLAVAEHYQHFGGRSPLNEQNREIIARLSALLESQGPRLRVYFGNRNWHPFLTDTLAYMTADGVRRALGFVTSAYSSYSSCRQYLEDVWRARSQVGDSAPTVDKIRAFFNHPGFISPSADCVQGALDRIPVERRAGARVLFTAHSIPSGMAQASSYEAQLLEAARLVAAELRLSNYRLVYQSRSGPPNQPWLEPDILTALRDLAAGDTSRDVVVMPLGFLSEHVEILWDLDTEARALAEELGLNMVRASTVGTHEKFPALVRELIVERVEGTPPRAIGNLPASPDACPADCCPWDPRGAPARPQSL